MATPLVIGPGNTAYQGVGTQGFNQAGAAFLYKIAVQLGALVSSDTLTGMLLDNKGAWNVTVDGQITGGQAAIWLSPGNTHASTITVSETGSLAGPGGIFVGSDVAGPSAGGAVSIVNSGSIVASLYGMAFNSLGAHTIDNSGLLTGGSVGISSAGSAADTVTNSGVISDLYLRDGTNTLTNSGRVEGDNTSFSYIGGSGNDTVVNTETGVIGGIVYLYDPTDANPAGPANSGTNSVTNAGSIGGGDNDAVIVGGYGADTVINSGTITGGVHLGFVAAGDTGKNVLNNSGFIGVDESQLSFVGGRGIDSITNSGTLAGGIYVGTASDLATANNDLTNTATGIIGGLESYIGGASGDTIRNAGTIASIGALTIALGAGTNSVTNSGSITVASGFAIQAGAGNDTIVNTGVMDGITLGNGTNLLTNSGALGMNPGGQSYIGGDNSDTITNTVTGVLAGYVDAGGGANKLINNGVIQGGYYTDAGGRTDDVTNTGTIEEDVWISGRLTNTGTLGSYVLGRGNDIVINRSTALVTASIGGDVNLRDGTNSFTNTGGTVGSGGPNASYQGQSGNDTVVNVNIAAHRGSFSGGVMLGDGDNSFTNSGDVGGDLLDAASNDPVHLSVLGGSGKDTVINTASGVLSNGGVSLGGGANTLTNNGSVGKDGSSESYVGGSGADTVTNGTATDTVASLAGGVAMGDGTNKLTNAGVIGADAIGASYTGGVGGDTVINNGTMAGGVYMVSQSTNNDATVNVLTNTGSIGKDAISYSYFGATTGGDAITNTGTMTGKVVMQGSGNTTATANVLKNTGAAASIGHDTSGYVVSGGDGMDMVTNSGTIWGGIDLAGGANSVTNSGSIGAYSGSMVDSGASVHGTGGIDTVTNSVGGSMSSALILGDGNNVVSNSGSIGSNALLESITLGAGNDSVTNNATGTIAADVHLGAGANKLTNAGTIAGTIYGGDTGTDTLTNTGTIHDVFLGGGSDVFNNTGKVGKTVVQGTVLGTIDLGDGADTFNGGNNAETVRDGNGADKISLGGGNDTYIATGASGGDLKDTIDGGAGIDTYDASGATGGVAVNLDTVQHDYPEGTASSFWGLKISASTAGGSSVSGQSWGDFAGLLHGAIPAGGIVDIITNFENVNGGASGDVLYGSSGANVMNGNGGQDDLFGFGGDDTIHGGAGGDSIWGGVGRDVLWGDGAADYFVYTTVAESTVAANGRDIIMDFSQSDGDKIDLRAIDADGNAGNGDTAFVFLGTNDANYGGSHAVVFDGTHGALIAIWTSTGQIVQGDINGDKVADFAIEFADPTHAINFAASDFVL